MSAAKTGGTPCPEMSYSQVKGKSGAGRGLGHDPGLWENLGVAASQAS